MPNKENKCYQLLLLLLPTLVVILFFLWQSTHFPIHDFANYYYAAKLLQDGLLDNQVYNALYFNELIKEEYQHFVFAAFYPNPPSLAIYYLPLTIFSWETAKLVGNMGSVVIFIGSLYLLFQNWKVTKAVAWSVPFLFLLAIKNNLLFGQPYLVLFSLLVLGYIAIEKSYPLLAAFSFPLAIFLKVSPITFLGLLFFSRKTKALFWNSLGGFLLLLISFLFLPILTWEYYLFDIFNKAGNGLLYNGFAIGAKSFEVLFKNLFVSDALLNPNPVLPIVLAFFIGKYLFKAMVLGSAIVYALQKEISFKYKFGLWHILLLLLSPNLSSYGMVLLIVPFLLAMENTSATFKLLSIGCLLIINFYPNHWFYHHTFWLLSFGRAMGLLGFYLLYLIAMTPKTKRVPLSTYSLVGMILLFILLFIIGKKQAITSSVPYALKEEAHILMKDYTFQQQQIQTSYWTAKGVVSISSPTDIPIQKIEPLAVESISQAYPQLKAVTIKKPILVNDSLLYYLTDDFRSPGFYTLKKQSIK